jgi:hypothetical protein
MNAFCKTLFGDVWNLSTVGAVMAAEVALTASGNGAVAVYLIPIFVLASVAWLARR